MILSTNNTSLLKACPFMHAHGVVYAHDLYGSRTTELPLNEWPHHHRPPSSNIIDLARRLSGRTLIDIEHGGAVRPNASGYEVEARGDWDYATTGQWPNPQQRWQDVANYHRDLYLTLHALAPTIEIGWWLTPSDTGAAYSAYRDYAFTGASEEVDRLRSVADSIVAEGTQIMDFAGVIHYIHHDQIGEGKAKYGGEGMTWNIRAEMMRAKVETAKRFNVPIVVYVNPEGLLAVDIETYLQPIAEHPDVDECVVWRPDWEEIAADSQLAEGLRFFQSTRLG